MKPDREKRTQYELRDVEEPVLFRDVFSFTGIPRVVFDEKPIPMEIPREIWITDTTFRDGQQARLYYNV